MTELLYRSIGEYPAAFPHYLLCFKCGAVCDILLFTANLLGKGGK